MASMYTLAGQIVMWPGPNIPKGWAACNGQVISIIGNEPLFELIGTTYGGDGINNFALPDLRSRVPVHVGQGVGLSNYVLGDSGGDEAGSLPAHTHTASALINVRDDFTGIQALPGGAVLAQDGAVGAQPYSSAAPNATMATGAVSVTVDSAGTGGGGNLPPYLAINFIICLSGSNRP